MSFTRPFSFFAVFIVCCFQPCELAYCRELHRLNRLSPQKAEEFLDSARDELIRNVTLFEISFKLYTPSNPMAEKFGKILGKMSGNGRVLEIVSDDGTCILKDNMIVESLNVDGGSFDMDKPFFEGLIFCPRDVSLIFLSDDQYSYYGPAKVCGRNVQQFISSTDIVIDGINFSKIKIFVDEQLKIILRVDFLADNLKAARRISVGSFKNYDGTWMPKMIEFFDAIHHRHTKLVILSARIIQSTEGSKAGNLEGKAEKRAH